MTAFLRCFLLVGWVGTSLFIPALHAETLRFATIDYCPFTCDPEKEDGKEGFMTEVVRAAFEPAGYTIDIQMLPYARAVRGVRSGLYDGIMVVGKEYAPDFIYPEEPTVVQRIAFLVNAGESWTYRGVESLKDVRVGIVKGFYYMDPDLIAYLEANLSNEDRVHMMHGEGTTRRGLLLLQSHRISTFLEGEFSALYVLRKMGARDEIRIAGYTNEAFEDYTGFGPWNTHAVQLAEMFSEKLAQLKASGELADILRRYGVQ